MTSKNFNKNDFNFNLDLNKIWHFGAKASKVTLHLNSGMIQHCTQQYLLRINLFLLSTETLVIAKNLIHTYIRVKFTLNIEYSIFNLGKHVTSADLSKSSECTLYTHVSRQFDHYLRDTNTELFFLNDMLKV